MKSFKFSKATRKNGKINILNKDNKSYSIAKYNIESLKNSIYLYYCFFIIQYVLALGMTNGYSGGVETFIDFICGYNPPRPILGLVTSAVCFVIIAVILKALLKKSNCKMKYFNLSK